MAGKSSAVMLANHGPVVVGKEIEAACDVIEELEQTARLAMLLWGVDAKVFTDEQARAVTIQSVVALDG